MTLEEPNTDIASRAESNFSMFLRRGRLVLRKSQRKLSEAEAWQGKSNQKTCFYFNIHYSVDLT